MRKIIDYTTISMDFVSKEPNPDVKAFSDRIREILTDDTHPGWQLDGGISTSTAVFTTTTKVDNKDVTTTTYVKSVTAGLVRVVNVSGYKG